jgi:hypothetical protein
METIKIRVFRGERKSFDANGKVLNENWTITLNGEREFTKYLKYIKAQGFCDVELESVQVKRGDSMTDVTDSNYKQMLNDTLNPPTPKEELDIKAVLKRLEKLEEENKELKATKVEMPEINPKGKRYHMYNKTELIAEAATHGKEFSEDMKKVDMIFELKQISK